MTHDDAMLTALAYAWGREDASGMRTAPSAQHPQDTTPWTFAEAFAAGYDDYNGEKRAYMTSVQSAYDTWQESRGQTIFRDQMTSALAGAR